MIAMGDATCADMVPAYCAISGQRPATPNIRDSNNAQCANDTDATCIP